MRLMTIPWTSQVSRESVADKSWRQFSIQLLATLIVADELLEGEESHACKLSSNTKVSRPDLSMKPSGTYNLRVSIDISFSPN
jgi:hypothetical protein